MFKNSGFSINKVIDSVERLNENRNVLDIAKIFNVFVKILGTHDSPPNDILTPQEIERYLIENCAIESENTHSTKINYGFSQFLLGGTEIKILNFLYGSVCLKCPINGCGEGIRYLRIYPSCQCSPCLGVSIDKTNFLSPIDSILDLVSKLEIAKNRLLHIAFSPFGIDDYRIKAKKSGTIL